MHERTQRAIARLLFVFCCAVPTAGTLTGVLITWTPWYHARIRAALERELSRETGLVIRIADFQRRAPATFELFQIRLIQPETRQEIGRVRQAQWQGGDEEVSILLRQPELQAAELASAWQLIHDRFLCRPERTNVPVRFAAHDLTIHSSGGAVTLSDVEAWIGLDGENVRASLQCVPAGAASAAPVTVTVNRDRRYRQPTTRWLLDAGETPLPCSALVDYLPPLARLGSEAEFRGRLRWHGSRQAQLLDLAGARFDRVSLDRLFEDQTHRLSGRATIEFDRGRLDPDGGRRDIVGRIRATHGVIGWSLLASAQQHLGFEAEPALTRQGDFLPAVVQAGGHAAPPGAGALPHYADIPYDLLALQFDLNHSQLKLVGVCRGEVGYEHLPEGIVICRDGYPLVRTSPLALDALAVVNAIAPRHSVMVPLAQQTHWLTEIFMPPAAPRPLSANETRILRIAERAEGPPDIRQPDSADGDHPPGLLR